MLSWHICKPNPFVILTAAYWPGVPSNHIFCISRRRKETNACAICVYVIYCLAPYALFSSSHTKFGTQKQRIFA